jgi:hypothetical protein
MAAGFGAVGFGTVPEELRRSAAAIAEALGEAPSVGWSGPSGEYGHAGVRAAFAGFVEDAERRARELAGIADRLRRGVEGSALAYEESDAAAAHTVLAAGAGVAAPPSAGAEPSELWKRLNPTEAEGR